MNIRNLGLALGAFAAGAAAWTWGARRYGGDIAKALDGLAGRGGEHVPTDLLGAEPPQAGGRAPEAFRPDPTAVPTAAERDALRPATGPAPSLAADRGSVLADAVGAA